jgi:hypothetical protein
MLHRCSFKGCPKTVEYPQTFCLPPAGWTYFEDWGPGLPEGLYCQAHADAIAQLGMNGGLDNPNETCEDILGDHWNSFEDWLIDDWCVERRAAAETQRVLRAVFPIAARRQDLVDTEDWAALVTLAQHPALNN